MYINNLTVVKDLFNYLGLKRYISKDIENLIQNNYFSRNGRRIIMTNITKNATEAMAIPRTGKFA